MLTGKEKLYFLLINIENIKSISSSDKSLSIDPLNDLDDRLSNDDLSRLFLKLDRDEKVIKLIKTPNRIKTILDDLDPYDKADDGCWHIEIKPAFERYLIELKHESEYKKFIGEIDPESKINKKHDLSLLHPTIHSQCKSLFDKEEYSEAVAKGFRVVKDKLRDLTGYENGSHAFENGRLHIKGAAAQNVDNDFNDGVKRLTMAIDKFRNEKSHTSYAKIEDPQRAYEYLTLSSLTMNLLMQAEILKPK